MTKKQWKNKKYRHLYRYICDPCGFNRTTLSHARASSLVCLKCQRGAIQKKFDDAQIPLFGTEQSTVHAVA